jgi:hypothetical protein
VRPPPLSSNVGSNGYHQIASDWLNLAPEYGIHRAVRNCSRWRLHAPKPPWRIANNVWNEILAPSVKDSLTRPAKRRKRPRHGVKRQCSECFNLAGRREPRKRKNGVWSGNTRKSLSRDVSDGEAPSLPNLDGAL